MALPEWLQFNHDEEDRIADLQDRNEAEAIEDYLASWDDDESPDER